MLQAARKLLYGEIAIASGSDITAISEKMDEALGQE
jgi:RNA polymerase-interacting CarD/CdnL/TRCF family regulator